MIGQCDLGGYRVLVFEGTVGFNLPKPETLDIYIVVLAFTKDQLPT